MSIPTKPGDGGNLQNTITPMKFEGWEYWIYKGIKIWGFLYVEIDSWDSAAVQPVMMGIGL